MANHLLRILTVFTLTVLFMTACTKPEDTHIIPEEKTPTTGDIIVSQSGNAATPQNPAISMGDQPATVTLLQSVSYKDPDGSIYHCEPQAVVTLTTDKQEVRVKDLTELTTIQQNTSQTQKGQTPVTYVTTQTFTLGGQTLTFDLSHEVYTYTTSTKQQVEMPYLKLSAAKNGEAKAETRSIFGKEIAVTGIRLIPVATRGTYTTEQTYEVHISFTVDVTAMNTSTPQSQTLCFEAAYTGVVETVNEYPDPQTTFAYTLERQGTASTTSPFTMNDKTRQMTLEWNQVAQYTYFSVDELATKVVTHEPRVKVSLTMGQDSVWAESKSALETVTPTEPLQSVMGSEPAVTTGKQVFNIGGQKLTLEYSYDAYANTVIEDSEVAIPYLEAQNPVIKSVSLSDNGWGRINGKDVKFYEVTVRIGQELRSVNLNEPITENVEYVVKYTGVEEVRLVKVTYRKDYEWQEAHDNILLAVFPIVYRDRTYSTGDTFTDRFIDNGRFPAWRPNAHAHTENSDFIVGELVREDEDSLFWAKRTIGMPASSEVRVDYVETGKYNGDSIGTWKAYISEKSYAQANADINLGSAEVIGADSISEQPSGWYYLYPYYYGGSHNYICESPKGGDTLRMGVSASAFFHDQYLVIDGQMITFLEFRGPYTFTYSEEDATMADGSPAKVYTYKGECIYFGKYFSGTATITLYQY